MDKIKEIKIAYEKRSWILSGIILQRRYTATTINNLNVDISISFEIVIWTAVDPESWEPGKPPYLAEPSLECDETCCRCSPYRSLRLNIRRWLMTLPMVIANPIGISMKFDWDENVRDKKYVRERDDQDLHRQSAIRVGSSRRLRRHFDLRSSRARH